MRHNTIYAVVALALLAGAAGYGYWRILQSADAVAAVTVAKAPQTAADDDWPSGPALRSTLTVPGQTSPVLQYVYADGGLEWRLDERGTRWWLTPGGDSRIRDQAGRQWHRDGHERTASAQIAPPGKRNWSAWPIAQSRHASLFADGPDRNSATQGNANAPTSNGTTSGANSGNAGNQNGNGNSAVGQNSDGVGNQNGSAAAGQHSDGAGNQNGNGATGQNSDGAGNQNGNGTSGQNSDGVSNQNGNGGAGDQNSDGASNQNGNGTNGQNSDGAGNENGSGDSVDSNSGGEGDNQNGNGDGNGPNSDRDGADGRNSDDSGEGGTDAGSDNSGNGTGSNDSGAAGNNAAGGGAPDSPAPAPEGGGGNGDPHYRSADGQHLSTQAAGEFWAMDSARGMRVQVRQQPWASSQQVAVITALALHAGNSRVSTEFQQRAIRLDGNAVAGKDAFQQVDLGGGAVKSPHIHTANGPPVMTPNTSSSETPGDNGATVIITHRLREGQQAGYEQWLARIDPVCRSATGHLDTQIVRPIASLTATYTVIIRFDTRAHLEAWMTSTQRRELVAQAQPYLATGDDFFIRSGLDFWFTPEGAKAKVPVRWKQALVTWSAIFPLAMATPYAVMPLLQYLGLAQHAWLDVLVNTGVVVALMVYVVMPRYTRLLQRWLFQ